MAIALVVGLSFPNPAGAVFNPIPINSAVYNADVVVEANATPQLRIATTATIDWGTRNINSTLMEVGFDTANPLNGLPAAGSIIVAQDNANYSFKMPPSYTAPNGILINTVITNGTFTLTTPAAYNKLSFLGLGGNGGDFISVKVHHQDGSFELGSFGCPDWFGGTGIAITMGGRIDQNYNLNTQVNGANPRVYFRDVTLTNTTSPVTSIELSYLSGSASSHNDILAVSGATAPGGLVVPIDVTGFTYDFVVEATATKRGRVISQTIVEGTNVWATSQSMDNLGNTANAWYERGYNYNVLGSEPVSPTNVITLAAAAASGLPAAGANVTNAAGDRIYTMPASYTANNAIYLSPSNKTATVSLTAPTTASVISFLGAAANGNPNVQVVVTHQDTSKETNIITVYDWFNQTPAYVFGANGRVEVDTAQFNNATNTAFTPRLFGCEAIVSAASPITQIDLTYTNDASGRVALFALSGTTDAIPPVFVSSPTSQKVNVGTPVNFSVSALANVAISYQWQKGTNGVFVNIVNGGTISGAQTTTLAISAAAESDEATYRCVATTGAGSVNSAAATLLVITPLAVVTAPGDSITRYEPLGGSVPGANEDVSKAIDGTCQKYLNFGNGTGITANGIPLGFVVTPSAGRTKLNAMILYTANDGTGRDPANVILQGSDNGGATWTTIVSNLVTMPDDRNEGSYVCDPLTNDIVQLRFTNDNYYASYRWYLTRVKGTDTLMQVGEVQLRGVVDTSGVPFFSVQPPPAKAFDGTSASFSVVAVGTPPPDTFWLRKNGASYSAIVDGGAYSGAQTTFLSISPVGFADAGEFVCVATNTSGSITSAPTTLTVFSTATDVTLPGDPITGFGETTTLYITNNGPDKAIDDFNTEIYRNGGSGLNAGAGFGDFLGPVGLVVTPSAGPTILSGLRVYTATDAAGRDPIDYKLEGSNNGGSTYSVISQGALNLPTDRGDNNFLFSPIEQPVQEILFANNTGYTSYRLTFNEVRTLAENSMQIGEIELLGVASAQPSLSITTSGGDLVITTTVNGTLQSSTNLSTGNWISEGPISGTVNITPIVGEPIKFYRVVIP